jgi:hypothetical protein
MHLRFCFFNAAALRQRHATCFTATAYATSGVMCLLRQAAAYNFRLSRSLAENVMRMHTKNNLLCIDFDFIFPNPYEYSKSAIGNNMLYVWAHREKLYRHEFGTIALRSSSNPRC